MSKVIKANNYIFKSFSNDFGSLLYDCVIIYANGVAIHRLSQQKW